MGYTKIKRTELPAVKKKLIAQQNGVCPICKKDITRALSSNIIVDHDHSTGIIRAALHRGCNGLEGKVMRLVMTWGKARTITEVIKTLENLISFWKLHKEPQTDLIYYNHKTVAEKRLAANKKRRKAYAAKKGA
jgi:hypothetical protein